MRGDLDLLIDEAIHANFSGWDFSWLDGRVDEAHPPWHYDAEVGNAVAEQRDVLDIDTGGGEVLARHAPFEGSVVATEGFAPNIGVAAATLTPLGVHVVGTESAPDNVDQTDTSPADTSSHLPFRDETFDVVLDRHSSYWPNEVARVLREGSVFLTQQRGVGDDALLERFGRPSSIGPAFDLSFAVGQLEAAGLEIVRAEEATTPMTFLDVGAFVYFVRAAPWVLPDFDVAEDRRPLEGIHQDIGRDGGFEVHGEHMLIVVRRA
jgi:SAM-dependent methyltransferase